MSAAHGRLIFDLSSSVRWRGPPVGIVRTQRELAARARVGAPETIFSFFDTRSIRHFGLASRYVDGFIGGQASLNVWGLPDPTGTQSAGSRIPGPLYEALRARRMALRVLER